MAHASVVRRRLNQPPSRIREKSVRSKDNYNYFYRYGDWRKVSANLGLWFYQIKTLIFAQPPPPPPMVAPPSDKNFPQTEFEVPSINCKENRPLNASFLRIPPAHEGLELGIVDDVIRKAIVLTFGITEEHITELLKDHKDLGAVANTCCSSQSLMCKPKALAALKVFDTFHLIAKESGKDSEGKKTSHLRALLVVATGCEPQYLINLLQKKLGIGLAEQTLLAALGHAALYSEKHSTRPVKAENSLEEVSSLQYRKMGFEEFCAAAITVYQLEWMESCVHTIFSRRMVAKRMIFTRRTFWTGK